MRKETPYAPGELPSFVSNRFRRCFGGGGKAPTPVAPPTPAPVAAPTRADSSGAKKKISGQAKRRVGSVDAQAGDILNSLSKGKGFTQTLGGSATNYTGEA